VAVVCALGAQAMKRRVRLDGRRRRGGGPGLRLRHPLLHHVAAGHAREHQLGDVATPEEEE
jgi:hypothetical protein